MSSSICLINACPIMTSSSPFRITTGYIQERVFIASNIFPIAPTVSASTSIAPPAVARSMGWNTRGSIGGEPSRRCMLAGVAHSSAVWFHADRCTASTCHSSER